METKGILREHSALFLWSMRLIDGGVVIAACLFAFYVVFGNLDMPTHYQMAVAFAFLLSLVVLPAFSVYTPRRGYAGLEEVWSLFLAWTTMLVIMAAFSFVTKTGPSFSRMWGGIWFLGGFGLMAFGRIALRRVLAQLRRKGFNQRHLIVIGSGEVGEHVLRQLLSSADSGFRIRGYFSDEADKRGDKALSYRVGGIDEAFVFVQQQPIDQIWLAMPLVKSYLIESILENIGDTTADIRLVPDIFSYSLINHSIVSIAGLPVLNLSVTPMDGVNRIAKFVEDKAIAVAILLLISPLLLLIAIGVKLSSPGPVFYRQERISWNGKPFMMYKFRSMPVDAESKSGAVWAKPGEDRATRFGSLLRRTSMDELPQFLNVLKGDMSIVGPRPERPVFVEKFKDEIPGYMKKHMVKAGITGWAQVNGWRGDTDLKTRIEHDLFYIENWSLRFDMKIIFLTIFKGFVNRNAY